MSLLFIEKGKRSCCFIRRCSFSTTVVTKKDVEQTLFLFTCRNPHDRKCSTEAALVCMWFLIPQIADLLLGCFYLSAIIHNKIFKYIYQTTNVSSYLGPRLASAHWHGVHWSARHFNESAPFYKHFFSRLSHILYRNLIVIHGASQTQLKDSIESICSCEEQLVGRRQWENPQEITKDKGSFVLLREFQNVFSSPSNDSFQRCFLWNIKCSVLRGA